MSWQAIFGAVNAYYCPTRIIHGIGSIGRLGEEVKGLGGRRVTIVTDPGIVQAAIQDRRLLEPLVEALERAQVAHVVYDGIGHDARVGAVDEAARVCRETQAEAVVAIGGGSALAAGKAAAFIATNGGSLGDHQGAARVDAPPLPVIAIPTTAGSGSEVSAAIPYYDEARGRKTATRSPSFFPRVAILDASLLATLPFRQAALSGVDALTHAMEAYLTTQATPITDALALAAVRMLARSLLAAAATPDLAAKEEALIGSTLANLACGNAGLGLVHLLNRPVNSLFPDVPYGQSIGTLLVPVMAFNLPASSDRFADMARAMGEDGGRVSQRDLGDRCLVALKKLLTDLQLPRCYAPEQVDPAAIPEMARMCAGGMYGSMQAQEPSGRELPPSARERSLPVKSINRRQATIGDVIRLYEQAFEGWALD